jgi:hypothetical protein
MLLLIPSCLAYPFFVLIGLLLGFLYRQTESRQFRRDVAAMSAGAVGGLLWAVGAASSCWCFWHHVCMGGHMQHPPYPAWHYVIDAGWVVSIDDLV